MTATFIAQTRGLPTKEVELAKEPKDEDDPSQLRRFAKRIAEMKWWNNNSHADGPAETQGEGEHSGSEQPQVRSEDQEPHVTSEDQEPRTRDEQQQTNGNRPASQGEAS